MRARARILNGTLLSIALSSLAVAGTTYEQRSTSARTWYTGLAVVANVMPGLSALYAPRCLPGYVTCKTLFAGASLIGAAGHVLLSAGQDFDQTEAILRRGFAGDWYLTGRHIAGDVRPDPLPEAPPPTTGSDWQPPPI